VLLLREETLVQVPPCAPRPF